MKTIDFFTILHNINPEQIEGEEGVKTALDRWHDGISDKGIMSVNWALFFNTAFKTFFPLALLDMAQQDGAMIKTAKNILEEGDKKYFLCHGDCTVTVSFCDGEWMITGCNTGGYDVEGFEDATFDEFFENYALAKRFIEYGS